MHLLFLINRHPRNTCNSNHHHQQTEEEEKPFGKDDESPVAKITSSEQENDKLIGRFKVVIRLLHNVMSYVL